MQDRVLGHRTRPEYKPVDFLPYTGFFTGTYRNQGYLRPDKIGAAESIAYSISSLVITAVTTQLIFSGIEKLIGN